jgi:predicted dehydrogenase
VTNNIDVIYPLGEATVNSYGAEGGRVGSGSTVTARADWHWHGVGRAYCSYEELAHDPGFDVAYVATPHGRHVEDVNPARYGQVGTER